MMWIKVIKMITKDSKRRTSFAILVILSIATTTFASFVGIVATNTVIKEYGTGTFWPAEIMIEGYTGDEYSNFTQFALNINKKLDSIDGVKWHVYPGGGFYMDGLTFYYGNKRYTLFFRWCNVEDPTFPNSKFVVEGRFFKSNNESSFIIESTGEQLLKDLGIFAGVGDNGTTVDWFSDGGLGINLTLVGVISNPLMYGSEENLLRSGYSSSIYVFVPLATYYTLLRIIQSQSYIQKMHPHIWDVIFVKVKEGYNIDYVAEKIKEKYPGAEIYTREDEESYLTQAVTRNTIITASVGYTIASVVMIVEVWFRRREIVLLKILGWKRKSLLVYYLIKYSLFGVLSSLIGFLVLISTLVMKYTFNNGVIIISETFFPILVPLGISAALLSSIPAVLRAYGMDSEKILRE